MSSSEGGSSSGSVARYGPTDRRYVSTLSGLRGLLALHVIIIHFLMAFLPNTLTVFDAVLYPPSGDAHWMVKVVETPVVSLLVAGPFSLMILFALSGYVLTMPFFDGRRERLGVSLWGRYFRLTIPIAGAILFSLLLSRLGLYVNQDVAAITNSGALAQLMPEAFLTPLNAVRDIAYNGLLSGLSFFNVVLWSIKYEFIGSIVVLAMFLVMPDRGRWIVIGATCFLMAFYLEQGAIFVVTIVGGALLGYFPVPKRWRVPALLVGLYLGGYIPGRFDYAWLPVLFENPGEQLFNVFFYNGFGAVLVVGAVIAGLGDRVLNTRIPQRLGDYSYSMYLLHLPIVCSLSCQIFLWLPRNDLSLLVNLAVYVTAVVALASVYARYVDAPSIRLARRFGGWMTGIQRRERPVPAPAATGAVGD